MSLKTKRVIIVVGIIGIIVLVFLVFLGIQSRRAKGLNISFQAPEQILLGVPFEVSVNVSNDSKSILKEVRLSLTLPEGIVFVGQPAEKNIDYKEIGNLGVGSLTQERFQLLALTGENSVKTVQANVNYLPTSLGSRFEKNESLDLITGGFGLPIDIVTPTKIFSGEDFETVISFKNSAEADFSNLKLIIDYPPSFNFVKSTAELEDNHREWLLGDLRKGSENEFKIIGNVIGPDNTFFNLKVSIESEFFNETYVISANTATISIAPSPLSLEINLNEDPDYLAKPGDLLRYTIAYVNNTDVGLKDAVVRAKLTGAMFDFSTLDTDASYRSLDNTLVWNASNAPDLALIPAGGSGSVDFDIRVKNSYPIKRLNDKNFTLGILAEIESPTVPYFVAAKKTVNSLKLETKVTGQVKVDAKAYFRDATAGILNEGPFPPKVNRATNFTVHWLITNYGTDISGIEVKAFLGPNVKMTNLTKSNTGSVPAYNAQTQEVSWQIDKIIATKGLLGSPPEAIFQVEVIPSQAGNYWPLIQGTSLKATDDFTGISLTAVDSAITTLLPDDRTVLSSQGIVVQ